MRTTEAIPNATSIWSRWRERRRTTAAPARASARFAPPLRLHIGCGDKHLDGATAGLLPAKRCESRRQGVSSLQRHHNDGEHDR